METFKFNTFQSSSFDDERNILCSYDLHTQILDYALNRRLCKRNVRKAAFQEHIHFTYQRSIRGDYIYNPET